MYSELYDDWCLNIYGQLFIQIELLGKKGNIELFPEKRESREMLPGIGNLRSADEQWQKIRHICVRFLIFWNWAMRRDPDQGDGMVWQRSQTGSSTSWRKRRKCFTGLIEQIIESGQTQGCEQHNNHALEYVVLYSFKLQVINH